MKKKWNLETFKVGDTVVQQYRWNVLAFDPKRSTVMPIKKFDSPIKGEEEEEEEEDEEEELAKCKKMLSMGIPAPAVRQKMIMAEIPEADITSFFSEGYRCHEEEEEEEEEEEKNFDFTKDFVKNVFTNCGIRDLSILGSSITDLNDKPIDDLNDCECIVITSPMDIGGRVARLWKHLHKSLLKTHKELNDSGKKFQVVYVLLFLCLLTIYNTHTRLCRHVLYDPAHKKDDKFVAAPWAYVPYNKMNIQRFVCLGLCPLWGSDSTLKKASYFLIPFIVLRKISGIGFTIEQTQTPNGLFVDSNLITRHVTKHGAKAYPWTRESLEKFNGE